MRNPSSRWSIHDVSNLIRTIEADIFVSLDYPPHRQDSKQDRRRKILLSANNFGKLSNTFPTKTIMPVVHGRTSSEIELSIQLIERNTQNPSWIGLGGVVPLLQHRTVSREISRIGPETFIAQSIANIRNAFPDAKIHIFGAGGTRTFPAIFALGADSADSIGWRQAAGFGSIFLPLKSQRAIKWNSEGPPPRKILDESDLTQLAACRCPICIHSPSVAATLSLFEANFHSRSIHNAWTTSHQMDYWPGTRAEMKLLVADGKLGQAWARATAKI